MYSDCKTFMLIFQRLIFVLRPPEPNLNGKRKHYGCTLCCFWPLRCVDRRPAQNLLEKQLFLNCHTDFILATALFGKASKINLNYGRDLKSFTEVKLG